MCFDSQIAANFKDIGPAVWEAWGGYLLIFEALKLKEKVDVDKAKD